MTILLLEGADGSGKSTLAKSLVEQHGFSSRHFGLIQQPFERYLHHILSLELTGNHVIDRLHPSEAVYGTVCRNHDRLAGVHRLLDRVLISLGAVMVYCDPGYEIAKANWASRKEQELEQDEKRYEAIYQAYDELLYRTSLPFVVYDYTTQSLTSLLYKAHYAAPPINPGPGLGHWQQGVTLIVGNGPSLSFIWHKHCSKWLAQQLDSINVDEREMYWVNAYNTDDEETDPSFVERLQPSQVIALGTVAKLWCHRHCISATEIPHPQYWRRFRGSERYSLLNLLEK